MPNSVSSKTFQKLCKPFFSKKTINFDNKIILVEKGEVVYKNKEITTHFNNYFNDTTKGLNIKKWYISDKLSYDPLVNAICMKIMQTLLKPNHETTQLFAFNFLNSDGISKILNLLDPTKKDERCYSN